MSNKPNWDILDFASSVSKGVETYFKPALVIVVIGIITASAWAVHKNMEQKKEKKAFEELFQTMNTYQERKADFAEAEQKEKAKARDKKDQAKNKTAEKEKDTEPEKPLKKATGDLKQDYGDVVNKLEAFINDNPGKQATGEAALALSEIYEEYKVPEKGAETLDRTLAKWATQNLMFSILSMRAGDMQSTLGACDKATTYWKPLADGTSFLTAQAQLKMGVCEQKLGKYGDARLWYEKVSAKFPDTAAAMSAKKYLRLLQFQQNNKPAEDKQSADSDKQQESRS